MKFLFGYKPVFIESGSMEPVIHTGSFIIAESAENTQIDIGDIIVFETDDGYVTHRLVGRDTEALENGEAAWLITKGDANRVVDPELLDPIRIKAKVIYILGKDKE